MIAWKRIVALALFGCIFALYVEGTPNKLCDNERDCSGDGEKCFKDSTCKRGTCICKKGYWFKFYAQSDAVCLKNVEHGATCDQYKMCSPTLSCRKCPEDETRPDAERKCLTGGSSVISALKITTMLVSLVMTLVISI